MALDVTPAGSFNVGGGPANSTLKITNSSTAGEFGSLVTLNLYAACSTTAAVCSGGIEGGVFSVGPAAPGVLTGGPPSNGCPGLWTIFEKAGEPGHFVFYPPDAFGLDAGDSCTITFPGQALRVPTTDTDPDNAGVQTYFSVLGQFTSGGGSDNPIDASQTTVIPAPPPPASGPTGQRAAALAKCKKKKSKKKRRKCRKRAAKLPL